MENYSQITRAIGDLTEEIRKLRRAVESIGKPETCSECRWAEGLVNGYLCRACGRTVSPKHTCSEFERRKE